MFEADLLLTVSGMYWLSTQSASGSPLALWIWLMRRVQRSLMLGLKAKPLGPRPHTVLNNSLLRQAPLPMLGS
jgi:hypothetical protein